MPQICLESIRFAPARALVLGLLSALVGAACSGDTGDDKGDTLESVVPGAAEVRWTQHGVPHVYAATWPDAAYAAAYAFARDHVCTLADQMIKVQSERALWFGPGEDDANLDTDFAFLHLGFVAEAEATYPQLDAEVQELLAAYASGYNAYLAQVGPSGLPSPCRDAAWVRPITPQQLLAYYINLGGRSSSIAVSEFVATAQPPEGKDARPEPAWADRVSSDEDIRTFLETFPNLAHAGIGSNGWALGSERSETGGGMVLSNTHFPSQGDLQWHEMHISVEGYSDVYGVSLMGVFPINIGFNDHVAWTHTVSPGPRLVGYRLELDPEDPTRYAYDGGFRDMTPTTYRIDVLQPDGQIEQAERTLWRSHYGPMLNVPPIGWSRGLAVSYRDANAGNDRMLPQWLAMNRATSLDAFADSFAEIGGIPWVHTVAASADGEVYYADASSLPYFSETASAQHAAALETDVFTQAAIELGFYLVDGSDPENEWLDGEPHRPGLVPFSEAPQLRRRDFVANSNDNHWLSNSDAPLEGYHYLYGGERSRLLLPRTRMSLMMLTETGPDAASAVGEGADDLWTVDELLAAFSSGRAVFSELLLEPARTACRAAPETVTVPYDGQEVAVALQTEVCDVLDAWDGRLTQDSTGAALWRLAVVGRAIDSRDRNDQGDLFARPFDPDRPVATPDGLATGAGEVPLLITRLARARVVLDATGIDPLARLGDVQFQRRGDTDFPRGGGLDAEGAFSIADYRAKNPRQDSTLAPGVPRAPVVEAEAGLTEEGWVVNAGNTWVMAMAYTDGEPDCRALMTYGQSEDPESEHFDDQAAAFTTGDWRRCLLARDEVVAGTLESVRLEIR